MSEIKLAQHNQSNFLLALEKIQFCWSKNASFILSLDSLRLGVGEKVFLEGPSGSGKSTLLSLICGIIRPDRGSICIDDIDIVKLGAGQVDRLRADKLGVIFQQFNLLPYGSVIQNVLLPLQFSERRRKQASVSGTPKEEARRLLQRLGISTDLHEQKVAQLSIGQQQRVAVGRAIIGDPQLVIADEPTSALDHDSRDQFLTLLFEETARVNAGLILVSHDRSLASDFDRQLDIREIVRTAVIGAQ